MPIFYHKGQRYNVDEADIKDFSSEFPNAYTVAKDKDGVTYRVAPGDWESFQQKPATPKEAYHNQPQPELDEMTKSKEERSPSNNSMGVGGRIDMESTIAKARQTADFAGGVAGEIKAQSGNPFPPKLSATDLDAFKTPEQKAEEVPDMWDDAFREHIERSAEARYKERMKPYISTYAKEEQRKRLNTTEGFNSAVSAVGSDVAHKLRDTLNEEARAFVDADEKQWTPEDAAKFRKDVIESTLRDPIAIVPESFKQKVDKKAGSKQPDEVYFAEWLNLKGKGREDYLHAETVRNLLEPSDEDAKRLNGIKERAEANTVSLSDKLRNNDSFVNWLGGSASPLAAAVVEDSYDISRQTTRALDKAEEIKEAYVNHQNDENFFLGAGKGVKDGLTDVDNWVGAYMVGDMNILTNLVGKIDRGEKLTQQEEDYMDAQAYKLAVEAAMADDLGWGYKSGNVTGVSVPFMLQMLASPVSSTTGAVANRALVGLGKRAVNKFGGTILKNLLAKTPKAITKVMSTTASKNIGKGLSRIADATTAGAAQTMLFNADRTFADAADRHLGNQAVVGRTNEQYGTNLEAQEGESWAKSIFKSAASNTSMNASEYLGSLLISPLLTRYGDHLAKPLRETLDVLKPEGLIRAAKRTGAAKAIQTLENLHRYVQGTSRLVDDLARQAEYDGLISEYLEEVADNVVNTAIGDMSVEDLLSPKQNAETILGLSWTSGAFNVLNKVTRTTSYITLSRKMKKADAVMREAAPEKWDKYVQELGKARKFDDIIGIYENFVEELSGEGNVESAASNIAEATRYTAAYAGKMGHDAVLMSEDKKGIASLLSDARENGYSLADAQMRKEAYDRMKLLEERFGSAIEPKIEEFGGPAEFLRSLEGNVSDEAFGAVVDYLLEKERYEGIKEARADDLAAKQEASRKRIDRDTHKPSGTVITASTTDPVTKKTIGVTVVNGDLSVDANTGAVTPGAGTVVIRYANGKYGMVDISTLTGFTAMNAEALKVAFDEKLSQQEQTRVQEEESGATQETTTGAEAGAAPSATPSATPSAAAPVQEAAPAAVAASNSADLAAELDKTEEGRGVKEQVDAWFAQGEEPGAVEQLLSSTAGSFAPLGMDYYNALAAESLANAAPAAEPANAAAPAEGVAEASSAPTSRIMRKKGAIDAEASFENGATAQEMADAYMQDFGDEEGLALSTAQERLAQVQEERRNTKEVERKNGPLRKQEKFWSEVVDLLTPKEETVAEVAEDSIRFDNQGNPIDESGRLILEEVESIDQISDQDFEDPTRNIILPAIPDNVAEAVGTNGKPVIIKKNIFERNLIRHSDLTPGQSRDILKSALYSPDIYGQNQKRRRVNNWVVISVSDKQSSGTNKLVLLEVNENKENVEIVHWHYLDKRGLEKLKRQTEREGGQLLILPSASAEEVGALSDLTSDLPSEGKGTDKSVTAEGTSEEISEKEQNVKSAEQNEGAEPAEPAEPAEGSGDKGAGQEGQGSKWRYSVHVDKQTGYTTLSREDASLAYPVGDGRWHPTAQSPEEMLGILRNPLNGMQEVLAQVEVTLENAIATRRMDQAIRERRKQEKKPKAPKNEGKPEASKNEGQFGLVSDTRMEELKEQLRKKLRGQLNAGLDPEILTIGMQIAVGHIDRGIKKFADFAKIMIEDLGDAIRPYLKAFYNGARDLPEVVDNGLDKEMTPYDEVRTFDTANFDKAVPDDMGAANIIVQEKNVEKHADEIEESGNKPVSLSGRTAVQAKVVEGIKQKMLSALEDGTKPFQSIVQVRNFAESLGMTVDRWGKTDILLQELVEDALVRAARELMGMMQGMVNEGHELDSAAVFEAIVKLYELQPTISMRSSNRVAMQQYSTPLPMAFVADAFVSAGNPATVLEPTAGNGMLVFAIPAERIHANELDETRLSNLREQGYDKVTRQDATLPFEGKYDAVVMNPPFGNAAAKDYDGYSISGLDPQIAINTLESMADNGRAAIIIGGNMEYADNGSIKGKKAFFSYLYDHYNVKGVVDMDGSLYQKQGTTYPTRMILIDGRRAEEERKRSTVYPPVESKALPKAETFEQLFEIVNELTNSNAKTNGHEVLRSSERPSGAVADNAPGRTDKRGRSGESSESDAPVERVRGGLDGGPSVLVVQQERGDTRDAGGRSGERGVHESGSNVPDGRVGVGRSESQSAAEHGRVEGQAGTAVGREAGVSEQRLGDVDGKDNTPGVPADGGTVLLEEKRGLDTDKLPYRPHNTAFSLESIAPAAMVEAMDETLKQIEAEHGNVEQWVQSELGYETLDDLHNALAAEQIDSVAMAIHQMQQGQALIIGDQTGVGKGRQMAALIRWAVRQGKKPIFVTQSANLFSDIYRDLVDIGSGELRPFIFNARNGENPGVIVDDKGEAVHKALTDNKQKKVFESGKLPDEFDFAVLTYSQVSSGDKISAELANANAKESGSRAKKSKSVESGKATPKATFLRAIAKDNYLFLDESHTAAGESNTGTYFQSLIKDAKAATFASATFAKRPDTMPLYALRTAMSKAKVEAHKLIDVIKKGGVTLQELMSRALTSAGQMVRRERDMRGVKTDWKTVSGEEIAKRARAEYDKAIEAFNAIIAFQNNYVKPYLKEQSKEMAQMMGSVKAKKGTENLGIDNVPFASKTYNYTKQLMLALKVDAIVEEVIAEIEAGRHPVIALESTMESSLDEYKPGDVVGNPSFGASLLKGLNSVMQYTVKTDKGYAVGGTVIPSDLGPEGEAEYYRVQQFINDSAKDIFVSPLDAIIRKLNERGYKVGELTGRKTFLEQNGEGDYVLRERTDRDKKRMTRDFNSGKLDVLILNKSASTGISLHASSRFEDQRQRTMIIAQPLSDINDYMQMIGRIDRTGQVHRGYYINLGLPIPAENRFLMMLSTKLKSLNANTTTSQDNESSSVEAPDLLNKYGDRVVVEYLRDNPDVYERIGEPLGSKTAKVTVDKLEEYTPQEDDARKITGRVALLPTEEQDAFYDEVVKRYNDLINYLNETNSNDLKITVLPLRAKTLSRSISSEGIDPTGSNPFARNAYVEEVEMDILRKPMSAKEVERTISQVNKGENPSDRIRSILQTVTEETKEKMAKEEERFRKAEAKMEEAIAKHDARIDAQKDMPDDAKAQAKASYRQQEQDKLAEKKAASESKIRFAHKSLVEKLGMFKPGQTYMMPDDLESLTYTTLTPAIFCGYKAKDSKITASTTFAVFATLDGRRRVEVKLSSSNAPVSISRATNENYDTARRTNLSNWDSQIPTGTRKKGYIMTGNILQAVADSQSENGSFPGQLISYTDINGGVHDGLLMPDNWTPSLLRASGVPINARASQLKDGETLVSSDGKVTVSKHRNYRGDYYLLEVPKSKKEGGKYYSDNSILAFVEDNVFFQHHGKFVAHVPAENIDRVLNALAKLGVAVPGELKQVEAEENETGVHHNEGFAKNKNAKSARIIPSDAEKEVSLQIEREFDDAVKELGELLPSEESEDFESRLSKKIRGYSKMETKELEEEYEQKISGLLSTLGLDREETGKGELGDKLQTGQNLYEPREGGIVEAIRRAGPQEGFSSGVREEAVVLAAAERELHYRRHREEAIGNRHGLHPGDGLPLARLKEIFDATNTDAEVKELFDKAYEIAERLGIEVKVEWQDPVKKDSKGSMSLNRDMQINLEPLTRTGNDATELPVTIAHELIHHATIYMIDLYNSGQADLLTDSQKKAVETIIDLYNKYKGREADFENPYGLKEAEEFAAQMADPRQRKALSHNLWTRVVNAAKTFKANGNDSLWTRLVKAIKSLFDISDKEKMDNAIGALIESFNETIYDAVAAGNGRIYHNDAAPSRGTAPADAIRRAYDGEMRTARFLTKETMVDYLASVKALLDTIAEKTGKGITDPQNVYRAMLTLTNKNTQELAAFDYGVLPHMTKAIAGIMGKEWNGDWDAPEAATLQRYAKVKHGIERDRDMAVRRALPRMAEQKYREQFGELDRMIAAETDAEAREALRTKKATMLADPKAYGMQTADEIAEQMEQQWYDRIAEIRRGEGTWREKQQRMDAAIADVFGLDAEGLETYGLTLTEDYSGMTETLIAEGEIDRKTARKVSGAARAAAYDFVEQYEERTGADKTDALWDGVRAVSAYSLEKQRSTGLVDAKYVEDCNRRYEFYVPLRNFAETTADEVYDYLDETYNDNNPVKTARGRRSEAGNPFSNVMMLGYQSITAGNKNAAVQHFWNLANRSDVKGFLVPSRTWHLAELGDAQREEVNEKLGGIADTTGDVILPRIPENATAQQVQDIISDFEDVMKDLKKRGLAFQGKKRARQEYRLTSKQQENAHRVKVYVNGEARYVTIVGDPRAALALNGKLNPESGVPEKYKAMQQFLSGAFTSQNPSFALANIIRDTQHANMRAFITESGKYWAKFSAKQAAMMKPGRLAFLLAKYENSMGNTGRHGWGGELDMRNETHRNFKRFMELGGATGYTFSHKEIENLKKLADMAERAENKTPKGQGYVVGEIFDFIRLCSESAELINRFAAFEASLEAGRSEQRAISDAQEITLNFSRKGAGKKSYNANRNLKGKTWLESRKYNAVNAIAWLSQFGRDHLIFWNAAVQGSYQTYKMIREHPAKTTFALGGVPIALSALALPALNAMICALMGDDEDAYYDELPDYVRQRNLCIKNPFGRGWLKIPLDPATQKVWAAGDAIGAAWRGKRQIDYWGDLGANAVGLFSPVDIYWGDRNDNLSERALSAATSFTPTLIQPLLHSYANRDWKGKPLYNDSRYIDQLPSYAKSFKSDKESLKALSKFLNDVGNSDADSYGRTWHDFATPGVMEELLYGYTGGYGQLALAAVEGAIAIVSDDAKGNFRWDNMPVVNRLWVEGDPGQTRLNIYRNYRDTAVDFMENVEQRRSQINREYNEAKRSQDTLAQAEALAKMKQLHDGDYQRYEILHNSDKLFQKYMKGSRIEDVPDFVIKGMLEAIEIVNNPYGEKEEKKSENDK